MTLRLARSISVERVRIATVKRIYGSDKVCVTSVRNRMCEMVFRPVAILVGRAGKENV